MYLWITAIVLIGAIVVLIGVIAVWRIAKDRRSGFPSKDERTQRITGRAATYSLIIGTYFMLALSWIYIVGTELLGYYLFDAGYALTASLLVQTISMLVLRWHFGRKGE
jgi:hypothetical protein